MTTQQLLTGLPAGADWRRLMALVRAAPTLLMLLVVGFQGLVVLPASSWAETPLAETPLKVIPNTIKLDPLSKDKAKVLLILRNTSTDSLANIMIDYFPKAHVKVEPDPENDFSFTPKETLHSEGQFTWKLNLSWNLDPSNIHKDLTADTLIFLAKYDRLKVTNTSNKNTDDQESARVPQVAYSSLQLHTHEIADAVEVRVETTLESLDRQHPGKVYLVITNKSDRSIHVDSSAVKWHTPNFIEMGPEVAKPKENKSFKDFVFSMFPSHQKREMNQEAVETEPTAHSKDLTLLPHQKEVMAYSVGTKSRVQPGKHMLVGTLAVRREDDQLTRNIIVTRSVEVGVLGESALNKLFGVPSFLFIPGILALSVWKLCWCMGWLKLKQDTGKFPLQFSLTDLLFWAAAITISIFLFSIYYIFNPDFIVTYGLGDLVTVWLLAVIGLGGVGYFLIAGGRQWYIRRRTPSESDQPIDILKKLDRQGLGILREAVDVRIKDKEENEKTYRAFLLQPRDPDRETSWVGPAIRVSWTSEADQKLQAAVDRQRKIGGDAGKVAKTLEKAGRTVNVSWQPPEGSSNIGRVYEAKTAAITLLDSDDFIIVLT